jgi:hypothetical protein
MDGRCKGWSKGDCEELLPTSESNLTFRSGKLSKSEENAFYGCGSALLLDLRNAGCNVWPWFTIHDIQCLRIQESGLRVVLVLSVGGVWRTVAKSTKFLQLQSRRWPVMGQTTHSLSSSSSFQVWWAKVEEVACFGPYMCLKWWSFGSFFFFFFVGFIFKSRPNLNLRTCCAGVVCGNWVIGRDFCSIFRFLCGILFLKCIGASITRRKLYAFS